MVNLDSSLTFIYIENEVVKKYFVGGFNQ